MNLVTNISLSMQKDYHDPLILQYMLHITMVNHLFLFGKYVFIF